MILHVTDFHANLRWYRWLVKVSSKYDLICLTGDMLDLNAHRSCNEQVVSVLPLLSAVEAPLAIVSGNHDSVSGGDSANVGASWLHEIRGRKRSVDGDTFVFSGTWIHCIPWKGSFPSAKAGEIWLCHMPPEAPVGISKGGAGWGSFELGEMLRPGVGPRLVLSGHVHEPQSWCAKLGRTWCLNPGQASFESIVPNHVEIDLIRGLASLRCASEGDAIVRI